MKLFFDAFESLGQYHAHWATVLLCAPDSFSSFNDNEVDQPAALDEAFEALRSGFHFAERKIKDDRKSRIMRELIEISYEAYVSGDSKKGAHALAECEGMIWPSLEQRVKHAVEAEKRAFGKLVTYADIKVSPLPYEGTKDDLTDTQVALYEVAKARCDTYLARREIFKAFVLVFNADGTIDELKLPSWRKTQKEIRRLATVGKIKGFVQVPSPLSGSYGLLCYNLESLDSVQISVRSLIKNYEPSPPKFHLDTPEILGNEA